MEVPNNNSIYTMHAGVDLHPLVNNNMPTQKTAVVTKTLVKSICLGVQLLHSSHIDNYADYTGG